MTFKIKMVQCLLFCNYILYSLFYQNVNFIVVNEKLRFIWQEDFSEILVHNRIVIEIVF